MPCIAPDLVVVIPVYKQPLFMVEAIGSVLDQVNNLSVATVVVDDGCPFASTYNTASVLAARYPGRVIYLRRENGGLSAARNSGIEFALKAWPSFKAIYFLDSDNRLLPQFLHRAWQVLERSGAGWAYPDFDMFGIPGFYSAKGDYSLLLHLLYNYCEAGSLVARAVFERGVRFDQTMRLGFEDWEFWLQAAQQGFRGVFVPCAGFCYRRRGESMLSQSERNRPEIIADIRRKHKRLFEVGNLLRLEAAELPRYRLVLVDRDQVLALLDPAREPSAGVSTAAFVASYALATAAPSAGAEPRLIVAAHSETIAILTRVKLIRYLFWLAESGLRAGQCLAVRLATATTGKLELRRAPKNATAADLAATVVLFVAGQIAREIVRDPGTDWVESLARANPTPKVALVEIELPAHLAVPITGDRPYAVVTRMVTLLKEMRRGFRSPPALHVDWREDSRTHRRDCSRNLFAELGLGTVLPHVPRRDRKQVGFLLPICDFGGVEKVVANYALTLTSQGYDCHLFITERSQVEFTALFDRGFESVNFIAASEQYPFDWSQNAPVLGGLTPQRREALGLLATMDVIFNTHSTGMHGMIGELKRLGAKTYVGLHLNEINAAGLPLGNANLALAYEHAYDGFVVISQDMRDWCLAQAVPPEKISLVRNAPSYDVTAQLLAATGKARARRAAHPGRLRVLYLGRLDAQKGLDRLAAISKATDGPAAEWRVVGRAVVDGADGASLGKVEPPALRTEELTRLYRWADVVVLPSRFEGVPLILLEAQRLGAVVIATDVGAVGEIVTDRVDGFLVDASRAEAAIIGEFVAVICELALDRGLLHRISVRAAARVAGLRWSDTMADFISAMTTLPERSGGAA